MEKVARKLKSGVPRISLLKLRSKSGNINDRDVGNPIKGGPEKEVVNVNQNIPTTELKQTGKSWSQRSGQTVKLKSLKAIAVNPTSDQVTDGTTMEGPENKHNSSVQPVPFPERKEAMPTPTSVLGDKLAQSKNGFKCEICGQHFSQKNTLQNHQLRKHLMAVIKDRLPASISEETLVSSLNAIVAKSKILARYKSGRAVHKCHFCQRREGYSLKVHLLKCHLNHIISEIEGTQQGNTLSRTRIQKVKVDSRNTSNIPSFTASRSSLKYSCNLCQKVFSTVLALKAHYRKKHLASSQSHSRWKCSDCEKSFSRDSHLRTHRISAHPTSTLSEHIPPGVSDDDFQKALNRILGKSKKVAYINALNCVLECPHCGKHVKQMMKMKLHITRCHLDEVLEAVKIKVIVHNATNNHLHEPRTKLEYIEIGEDANGFPMEYESDVDPLSM